MVREFRVLIDGSSSGDADFGSGYLVTACKVGAQVSSASSGQTVNVRAGHGFAAGDKMIVGTGAASLNRYREVVSVTSLTVVISESVSVATGEYLVNLGPDTGTTGPNYDGEGAVIYSDMGYVNQISGSTVAADAVGRYRYFHKGIPRWELVRTSGGTPYALYLDAGGLAEEDPVSYGVQYPHLLAASGAGTLADPWPGAAIQAAWDALAKGAVGGGGVIRMLPGVYDLGSGAIGLDFTITGDYASGITFEGYNHGNQGHAGNAAQNDDGVILLYSGTGVAIKLGHFATNNTYWMESCVFRGFKIRQSGTAGTGIGILGRLVRFSRFQDINVSDMASGLALGTISDFNEIDNVTLNGNAAFGVDIGRTTDETGATMLTPHGQCNANRIINSNIRNTARDNGATAWGIYIHSNSVGTVIKHNEFHDFDTANYGAIGIVEGSTDCSVTVVDSNYFEGNWVACYHNNPLGAAANDMVGLVFTNNYVTQIEAYGVWVNSGSTDLTYGVKISGNLFQTPTNAAPYNSSRGVQLGTYVTSSDIGTNSYRVQSPLGHTLTNGNFNHGELGTLTEDKIILGSLRVADITGRTPAITSTGRITGAGLTSTGDIQGLLATQAFTGNDTIAHGGRTVVDITNTSGANTLVVAAPSSNDGKILILRVKAITAGSFVIADSGNVSLSAAWDSAVGATAGSTLTLIASGVVWYEIARSKNT